ncbi:MAG: hypothetical protein JPMHGGIA_00468 [Saprospiraceae bacterium]|jgi:hypothetical protein|nr:hypothetical protein [Saprospiraceae bacterium]
MTTFYKLHQTGNTYNQRTGVSTFASRTSPSTNQSLQKSFHLSHADKIELKKISSPSENKKYATTLTNTTKTMKLNNDNSLQTRWTRTPAGNSTLPKVAVSCFVGQFCGYINFSASLKVCAENRHLRQAAKRCGAIRRHIGSPDCMRRCGLERLTSAHLRDFSADRSFATPAPKPRKSGDPKLPAIL